MSGRAGFTFRQERPSDTMRSNKRGEERSSGAANSGVTMFGTSESIGGEAGDTY